MKASEIGIGDICRQIRVEEEYLEDGDINHLEMLKQAAMEYVRGYTGLTDSQIDSHEDITAAVLVLISDMYDNRQMHVNRQSANRVADTILGMYCENLV